MNEHIINGALFDGKGGVKFPLAVVKTSSGRHITYLYSDKELESASYGGAIIEKLDVPTFDFGTHKFYGKETLSLFIENKMLKETLDAIIISTLN